MSRWLRPSSHSLSRSTKYPGHSSPVGRSGRELSSPGQALLHFRGRGPGGGTRKLVTVLRRPRWAISELIFISTVQLAETCVAISSGIVDLVAVCAILNEWR